MSETLAETPSAIFGGLEYDRRFEITSRARKVRIALSRSPPPGLETPEMGHPARLKLSVLVCAYNEERNLPHFLDAVFRSKGPSFELLEVVCVASGCTDRTVEILHDWQRKEPRVRVVIQAERLGKASAMAEGMNAARGDLVLIENADTVPTPGALEELAAPFAHPDVGLVCSRPIPAPDERSVTSKFGRLIWDLHDQISRIVPKAGEAFAVRRVPISIPHDVEDDDTFIGIYAGSRSGRSVYASHAFIVNRVPDSPADFLRQRYRINRQVIGLWRRKRMKTSTWQAKYLLPAVEKYFKANPRQLPRLFLLSATEAAVRALALLAALVSPSPLRSWAPIESTKWPIDSVANTRLPQH